MDSIVEIVLLFSIFITGNIGTYHFQFNVKLGMSITRGDIMQ